MGALNEDQEAELRDLATHFGEPLRLDAEIHDVFFDPIQRPDRTGEVCMVIRRPNGKLLLSTKTFYPPGAYRLPTGGIDIGEGIVAALAREAHEETGLDVAIRRFLADITYRATQRRRSRDARGKVQPAIFRTVAFLMDEIGGTLGALDAHERIKDHREVDIAELPAVAERLASLGSEPSLESTGDWADWGRFRAVVHRAVHEALTKDPR